MKCPVCGGAELVRDTRDIPYTYKGATIVAFGNRRFPPGVRRSREGEQARRAKP